MILLLALVSCGPSQPVVASPPVAGPSGVPRPEPVGIASITDEQGAMFEISQGAPGDPAVIGCADGQREAFVGSPEIVNLFNMLSSSSPGLM